MVFIISSLVLHVRLEGRALLRTFRTLFNYKCLIPALINT